jgi:hypothetical protein
MQTQSPLVFLLDVDNTLLDNDAAKEGIASQVAAIVEPERSRRFWEIYEEVRDDEDYVDFPATVARFAAEERDPQVAGKLMSALNSFPFAEYVYPHALDTIDYLNSIGEAVVLSDGDPVFQRHKIDISGIAQAVEGRVMVVVHKENQLDEVFRAFPAHHYAAVDDKPRIVSALEACCPTTFTTVLVEQGKYAEETGYLPAPDIVVPTIGDVRTISRSRFLQPHPSERSLG